MSEKRRMSLFNPFLNPFSLSVVSILISPRKNEPHDKKLFCKSKFSGHRGLNSKRGPCSFHTPLLGRKARQKLLNMGSFTDESFKFK
jgi:hypothetical protein